MNKSTPINQLPLQNAQVQASFVNDQQRHMITQAQNAIQHSTLPQNTQLPNEVINEDDSAIQDMLNNLSQQHEPTHMPTVSGSQNAQEELLRIAAMNNINMNQLNAMMGAYGPPSHAPAPMSAAPYAIAGQITSMLSSEIRIAGFVFVAVLIVQFVPFGRFLGKYVAIDKIPYSDVLLRATIASLLVVVLASLAKR